MSKAMYDFNFLDEEGDLYWKKVYVEMNVGDIARNIVKREFGYRVNRGFQMLNNLSDAERYKYMWIIPVEDGDE